MQLAAILLPLFLGFRVFALDVRASPGDYPVQGAVVDMKLGAEYMVTTVSAEGQTFSVHDYLVVELGVFPQKEANVDVRRFSLRINGKRLLAAQSPGMVAASLKYPDWTTKPVLEAEGGPIVVGGTSGAGRFRGDRRAGGPPPLDPAQGNRE